MHRTWVNGRGDLSNSEHDENHECDRESLHRNCPHGSWSTGLRERSALSIKDLIIQRVPPCHLNLDAVESTASTQSGCEMVTNRSCS
jgi:hypothetical protein